MAVETGLAPSVLANLSGHSVAMELTVSHSQCVKSYESNIKLSAGEAGGSLIAVFLELQ